MSELNDDNGAADQPESTRKHGAEHLAKYKWQPGQSGNPSGRRKGESITAKIRNILEGKFPGDPNITTLEALSRVIVKEALKGDYQFAREILDRLEGKVPNKNELTGADGGPIVHQDREQLFNDVRKLSEEIGRRRRLNSKRRSSSNSNSS